MSDKTVSTAHRHPSTHSIVNLFLIYVATGLLGVHALGHWYSLNSQVPLILLGGNITILLPKVSIFVLPLMAATIAFYASAIIRKKAQKIFASQQVTFTIFTLFCSWSFLVEQAWFSQIAGRSRSVDSWLILVGPIMMILVWKTHAAREEQEQKARYKKEVEHLHGFKSGMVFVSRHPVD